MEIFRLFGSILMNTDEADKSLGNTESKAKKVAETLGKGITTAAKWGAGLVTAAAGAATGLVSLATQASGTADTIDKMSQKIGISREAFQEMDYICSQSGTSVEQLQGGLETMRTAMAAAAESTSEEASVFDKLGVSISDNEGKLRDTEAVMWDVFSALQGLEDQTKKEILASELFGGAGAELLPMLNGQSGSIEAMKDQAHELGLVMSDELVDNGVNLTDAIDQMKRSLSAVATKLGGSLMPLVEKTADFITANIPLLTEIADKITPMLTQSADNLITPLLSLAEELLPELVSLVMALLPAISSLLSSLTPIITGLISKLVPIVTRILEKLMPPLIKVLDEVLMPLLDLIMVVLEPILDVLLDMLDPIADIIAVAADILAVGIDIINKFLTPFMPLIELIMQAIGAITNEYIKVLVDMLNNVLMPILEGVTKFLSDDFLGAAASFGEGFVGYFQTAFDTIDKLFGTNLGNWYNQVTSFWKSAGAKLYELTHGDEIDKLELDNKYGGLDNDIILKSNQYMRQGMSAEEAMKRAEDETLDTSEKMYYYDNYLAGNMDKTYGSAEQRYRQIYNLPEYATGGVAYGKTAAIIGDNSDAAVNPEVVAPLSELERIMGKSEQSETLSAIYELLKKMLDKQSEKQPLTINITLGNGAKLASAIVDDINNLIRIKGSNVFIQT